MNSPEKLFAEVQAGGSLPRDGVPLAPGGEQFEHYKRSADEQGLFARSNEGS